MKPQGPPTKKLFISQIFNKSTVVPGNSFSVTVFKNYTPTGMVQCTAQSTEM
uniref:Uncharacterized protein n=1 Tax=Anguilla anguilla TaxID=7936 RepID=A0A0E9W3B2_ANGAN